MNPNTMDLNSMNLSTQVTEEAQTNVRTRKPRRNKAATVLTEAKDMSVEKGKNKAMDESTVDSAYISDKTAILSMDKPTPVSLEKKMENNVITTEETEVHEPNPDYLLELRMDNGITFKGIIESLKNVLNEANFIFSEKGLRMIAFEWLEEEKMRAASLLTMSAEYFDVFHCQDEQIVGLDILQFYKLIKPLKMNDSLSFIIHKDQRDKLRIVISNKEKRKESEHHVNKKNLPDQIYEIGNRLEFGFDYAPPVIDSQDLQAVCRSLNSIDAPYVVISYMNDTLRFEGYGDSITSFYNFQVGPACGEEAQQDNASDTNAASSSVQVSGIFPLEDLHNFTKAAHHLSHRVVVAINHENYALIEYALDPRNLNTLRYLLSHTPMTSDV